MEVMRRQHNTLFMAKVVWAWLAIESGLPACIKYTDSELAALLMRTLNGYWPKPDSGGLWLGQWPKNPIPHITFALYTRLFVEKSGIEGKPIHIIQWFCNSRPSHHQLLITSIPPRNPQTPGTTNRPAQVSHAHV